MARLTANQGLIPSLLDRLIDPDSDGTSWQRGYTPRQMMEAVRRDLEELFNTHESTANVPESYTELLSSVFAYGLPDLPSLYNSSINRRQDIPSVIASVVERFEPRLRDVRVVMVDAGATGDRKVRFHIEAGLNVDPSPEVAFETILELATGQASIRAGGS
jgi:type VI secretion system protein ImpF